MKNISTSIDVFGTFGLRTHGEFNEAFDDA